jgi:hypothetical protein
MRLFGTLNLASSGALKISLASVDLTDFLKIAHYYYFLN